MYKSYSGNLWKSFVGSSSIYFLTWVSSFYPFLFICVCGYFSLDLLSKKCCFVRFIILLCIICVFWAFLQTKIRCFKKIGYRLLRLAIWGFEKIWFFYYTLVICIVVGFIVSEVCVATPYLYLLVLNVNNLFN